MLRLSIPAMRSSLSNGLGIPPKPPMPPWLGPGPGPGPGPVLGGCGPSGDWKPLPPPIPGGGINPGGGGPPKKPGGGCIDRGGPGGGPTMPSGGGGPPECGGGGPGGKLPGPLWPCGGGKLGGNMPGMGMFRGPLFIRPGGGIMGLWGGIWPAAAAETAGLTPPIWKGCIW